MARFKPISLARYYNCPVDSTESPIQWHPRTQQCLSRLPRGRQPCWGIPFNLGHRKLDENCLIALHPGMDEVRLKLSGKAAHICILHLADFPNDYYENLAGGDTLAEYIVSYQNGSKHVQPIRMRFEINSHADWGMYAFASQPARMSEPLPKDPTKYGWGLTQTGVPDTIDSSWAWIYALELPETDSELASLIMKPASGQVAVMAVTLYDGPGHPLRHVPKRVYKLILPEKVMPSDLKVNIDMGIITRTYAVPGHVDERWLKEPDAGLGLPNTAPQASDEFLVEATGALGASLKASIGDDREHEIAFGQAFEEGKAKSSDGAVRIEMLDGRKTWVHVTVIDTATGSPTPTRIHFQGAHGEYLPPYGHRHVVNDNWFEDYGGDLQLGSMSYAYVPGRFQIELPEGEVYVEISKGFEYTPVRQKLNIKPGQRELKLGISRWTDLRSRNWVTADTHVHFISPETAWLEGQAEGLNLINLLASQWGDLFTNVADITGNLSGSSREDTLVWVGTENRHHLLGHMSMLGVKGDPVFPMCSGGPEEAAIGDPDYTLITEWAEKCREKEGIAIRPHFPFPVCEEPVYMLLDKLDGTELRRFADAEQETLDEFHFKEWYRYLNCGCRVAAVGGTDKMSAGMPVGGVRTYAMLSPDDEFSFKNWGKAVRTGRTFTTSGPVIELQVDGKDIGEEIRLPSGGGRLEIRAQAESAWPIHKMEVVVNGKVVASTSSEAGEKQLSLSEHIELKKSCWVAARCSSKLYVQHCWTLPLAAHTSPVYVVVGDEEVFNPSDASYMLTLIDGGLTYLDTLSVKFNEDRHLAMKALFERARQVIHQKMHQHGIPHG